MNYNSKDLKEMANAVRAWALHAIRNAGSGHIGIVLGAADIITVVYANFLRRGRDRFVMSVGHGSALLYSVLKLAGYNVGDMGMFRKMGGLPGHPEYGIDGVETTTGPLGQGVGNAVGMALAEKINKTDARVYCLCSDGDLMEGVAQEAIAFAGRYKLNNLVLMWDDNGISIDGAALTDVDVPARMVAAGWKFFSVDGHDFVRINRALENAKKSDVPVFIQCKTEIGRGASVAGTSKAHGFGVGDAELMQLVQKFISVCGDELWRNVAMEQVPVVSGETKHELPHVVWPVLPDKISMRELSGLYLDALLRAGVGVVGGSADLGGSTSVRVGESHDIAANDFSGNYINFGVREGAMAAILNGMALSGLRVFGSTFLVFSDYMRPAMRLSALMGVPVVYVLTHDSVAVGEDGPTHQPVEQLPSLRMIPNMNVFRPCNGVEVAYVWRRALSERNKPSCIVLSRQKIHQVATPLGADLARGAYIVRAASASRVRMTILATGTEVSLAIDVAERLGDGVQVVSVLSVSDFRAQQAEYKQDILRGFVVAIEAAAGAPWFEFADAVVGVDGFGMSGPGDVVYRTMGFDVDAIVREILDKIK
ncbi:MAG: transketolase family protein [Alphaproteobacteria bacterium]|nr:transketolase family protein [Alphaproteobacteria bacterium]